MICTGIQKPMCHVLSMSFLFPGHKHPTSGGKCKGSSEVIKQARALINEYCLSLTKEERANKRKRVQESGLSLLSSFGRAQYNSVDGDVVILKFLAAAGIAPNMLGRKEWKNVVTFIKANPLFESPVPKDFGTVQGVLHPKFQSAMDVIEKERIVVLGPAKSQGGTLVSDAGTKLRRCTLATLLQLPEGGAHVVQQTDATGIKKDAEYIMADILKAIQLIGAAYIFLLVMDGASVCKSVLKNITSQPGCGQIFGLRCCLHGLNLVIEDIGKELFPREIEYMVRLVKFIANHGTIYSLFLQNPNMTNLRRPMDTRFCSTLLSVKIILADWDGILSFLGCDGLKDLIKDMNAKDRDKLEKQRKDLARKACDEHRTMENRLQLLLDITEPLVITLRLCDSYMPSLCLLSHSFETSCITAYNAATRVHEIGLKPGEENAWARMVTKGFLNKLKGIFAQRSKHDIQTDLVVAGAFVWPMGVYNFDTPYDAVMDMSSLLESGGTERGRQASWGFSKIKGVLTQYYVTSGMYNEPKDGGNGETVGESLLEHALILLRAFRDKRNWFASLGAKSQAAKLSPGAFWSLAGDSFTLENDSIDTRAVEVFIKLGYAGSGQGAAERLLRMNSRVRTPDRNRQHPTATTAFCKARMQGKTEEVQADKTRHKSYIEYARKQLRNAREVALKEALAKEEAAAKKEAEAREAREMARTDAGADVGAGVEAGAASMGAGAASMEVDDPGAASMEAAEEDEGEAAEEDEGEAGEEQPELFEVVRVAGDYDEDDPEEEEEVRMVGFAAQIAMRLAREEVREERPRQKPARYRN